MAKKKTSPSRSESRKMDKQVRMDSEVWAEVVRFAGMRGLSGAEYLTLAARKEIASDRAAIRRDPEIYLGKPKGK